MATRTIKLLFLFIIYCQDARSTRKTPAGSMAKGAKCATLLEIATPATPPPTRRLESGRRPMRLRATAKISKSFIAGELNLRLW
jgi:hypothetical protein